MLSFPFWVVHWRRVQSNGLVLLYGEDESFRLLILRLSALTFLPAEDIPDTFLEAKKIMSPETHDLVKWFKDNFALGRVRRVLRNGTI